MFFIMGISQKEKELEFNQVITCKCCKRYSNIQVYMTYTYFMLFFIPLFKWNKRYYVKNNCCGSVAELDNEIGRKIENGEPVTIDTDNLDYGLRKNNIKVCSVCGYTTDEDFIYCPKCSNKF